MNITTDSLVFSKPRNQWVLLRALSEIIVDQSQTEDGFYANCNAMFPVSLGPMSQAEMDGQRQRDDWILSHNGGSDRSELIYKIQRVAKVYNFIAAPPAACDIDLPNSVAPLLPNWKAFGAMLYGRDDFTVNFVETLRRDVVPQGPVVGGLIHDDLNFETAFRSRGFSIISVVAESAIS